MPSPDFDRGNPAVTKREFALIGDTAAVSNCLPFIKDEVQKMKTRLDRETDNLIRNNQMTGDVALSLLQRRSAYDELLRHFEQRMAVSTAVGERVRPMFETTPKGTIGDY